MITQAVKPLVRCLVLLASAPLIVACAGSSAVIPSAPVSSPTREPIRQPVGEPTAAGARASAIALEQVGIAYRYGGQSPATGFDCSGLVHYAYLEAGVALPRTTRRLWSETERVARHRLREGDLVFFSIEGKMQHVGLYIGDDRFVHAPSTGRTVSVESLSSPFYREALLSGGRPP